MNTAAQDQAAIEAIRKATEREMHASIPDSDPIPYMDRINEREASKILIAIRAGTIPGIPRESVEEIVKLKEEHATGVAAIIRQIQLRDQEIKAVEAERDAALARADKAERMLVTIETVTEQHFCNDPMANAAVHARVTVGQFIRSLLDERQAMITRLVESTRRECPAYLVDLKTGGVKLHGLDLVAHLHRQRSFSERAFGPGSRTTGVLDHIRKELAEIEADPTDVSEWIDVVLLALDGAWRHGFTPEQIAEALAAKQSKNESRTWPDWRKADPGKAIEHDRSKDVPLTCAGDDMPTTNDAGKHW